MDSFFKVFSLCVITLETGSANIFNSITKVIVEFLIPYEVPYFYGSSGVMGGRLVIHSLTRLETVLARQKFCRCSAMNNVMMSSLSASGSRSLRRLILRSCSIVSSVTGGGGSPLYDLLFALVKIFVCENSCESGICQSNFFV